MNGQSPGATESKERPIGVLIIGVYLIIQGIFAISYYSELGSIAIFLAGTFMVIGIGLFRGSKGAYIATMIVSVLVLVLGVLIWYDVGANNISIASVIVGGLIIFYLTREVVRDFFFKQNKQQY